MIGRGCAGNADRHPGTLPFISWFSFSIRFHSLASICLRGIFPLPHNVFCILALGDVLARRVFACLATSRSEISRDARTRYLHIVYLPHKDPYLSITSHLYLSRTPPHVRFPICQLTNAVISHLRATRATGSRHAGTSASIGRLYAFLAHKIGV